MSRVLHILPRVPPAVCGVADYAWLLARELQAAHGVTSSFLSAGTDWKQSEGETEFPVFRLPALTATALQDFMMARRGQFQAVILHLSPYGYQKRGVPFWLAAGWRWLAQMPGRPRLLTMFHELYASGLMMRSSFWFQPWQKSVLRVVAKASDGLRTNREAYAEWLRQIPGLKTTEVVTLPVFSNLGEISMEPSPSDRWQGMTVFASTLANGQRGLLQKLCQHLGIKRLGWIGAHPPLEIETGLSVRQVDHLPAQQAPAWFRDYGFSLTHYQPEYLAKSGIFAAYAAHRVTVVLPKATPKLPDGLHRNREFVALEDLEQGEGGTVNPEKIADGLHHWYRPHNVANTAASYMAQLTA